MESAMAAVAPAWFYRAPCRNGAACCLPWCAFGHGDGGVEHKRAAKMVAWWAAVEQQLREEVAMVPRAAPVAPVLGPARTQVAPTPPPASAARPAGGPKSRTAGTGPGAMLEPAPEEQSTRPAVMRPEQTGAGYVEGPGNWAGDACAEGLAGATVGGTAKPNDKGGESPWGLGALPPRACWGPRG